MRGNNTPQNNDNNSNGSSQFLTARSAQTLSDGGSSHFALFSFFSGTYSSSAKISVQDGFKMSTNQFVYLCTYQAREGHVGPPAGPHGGGSPLGPRSLGHFVQEQPSSQYRLFFRCWLLLTGFLLAWHSWLTSLVLDSDNRKTIPQGTEPGPHPSLKGQRTVCGPQKTWAFRSCTLGCDWGSPVYPLGGRVIPRTALRFPSLIC